MDNRSRNPFPLLLPLLALAGPPAAAAETAQIVMTQASEVDGSPVQRATVGVAAPDAQTLPFYITLTYRCPAGTEREQLFVSIADTAGLQDATGGPSPRTVRVDVPLKQLQWLAEPAKACDSVGDQRPPDEVDDSGTRYFRLHAGAAGYAAVTCRGKGGETSTATSSVSLDAWLSCPATAGVEPGSR